MTGWGIISCSRQTLLHGQSLWIFWRQW